MLYWCQPATKIDQWVVLVWIWSQDPLHWQDTTRMVSQSLGNNRNLHTGSLVDTMWPHRQSWLNCCRSISNLIQMLLLSLSQIMENRDWSCWRRRRSLVLPWLLASGRMLLCGMILPATIPRNGSVRTVMSFSLKLDLNNFVHTFQLTQSNV